MLSVCVLTMSDKGVRGEREDKSGPLLEDMLRTIGAEIKYREILPDEKDMIKDRLVKYSGLVDLILTTGGTGLSPRDVTPDATIEVVERSVPGIAEAIRAEGMIKTKRAALSRGISGVLKGTLIINLPGSPKGAKEGLEAIIDVLPHAIEKIKGSEEECAAWTK